MLGNDRCFEIVWTGDALLADAAQRDLDAHGYDWPFEFVRPLLAADYLIGNAEGPITTRTEVHWPDRDDIHNHNADPRSAAALARAGFDAMSLANNHALDRGPDGLADTVGHLRAAGIRPFGAGATDAQAQAPLLIDTPFGAVAVVGIGKGFRYGRAAGPDTAGTLVMSRESVPRARELARAAGARWVVAFVHWGANYEPLTRAQRLQAAGFAAAGYDLVVGHGTHTAQPVELINGMPVLYSLGNFTFGTPGRFGTDQPGHGLVARTIFTPTGLADIELIPIATDNRLVRFQPRPLAGAQAVAALGGLGPAVAVPEPAGSPVIGRVRLSGPRFSPGTEELYRYWLAEAGLGR
jgi:poly-gamma-glutamate capsule biosynthesis protein CapA/YwtB (metallophosphatase superfamily)